jgi:hypothetical protein
MRSPQDQNRASGLLPRKKENFRITARLCERSEIITQMADFRYAGTGFDGKRLAVIEKGNCGAQRHRPRRNKEHNAPEPFVFHQIA